MEYDRDLHHERVNVEADTGNFHNTIFDATTSVILIFQFLQIHGEFSRFSLLKSSTYTQKYVKITVTLGFI